LIDAASPPGRPRLEFPSTLLTHPESAHLGRELVEHERLTDEMDTARSRVPPAYRNKS